MNPRINQLVKSLLQKDTLDQCTLPELEQFAERHPYFGAAQLLLTKKMQTDSPDRYEEQLQKTYLFFHNPLWVEHLLGDNGKALVTPAPVSDIVEETLPAPEKPAELLPVTDTIPSTSPHESVDLPEAVVPDPVLSESNEVPQFEEPPVQEQLEPPVEEAIPIPVTDLTIKPMEKPASEELLFEPYHTVDYFASQGIRFKEEEKPQDKFGRQLKSFTEWLKTMKKLPETELTAASEPVSEKKVEEMAEKSLREGDVSTEAMAEVWEKQGNTLKAIEIYEKLSLLEPSKSTYFAAKIEVLKKLT